jgi:hypothetical protein
MPKPACTVLLPDTVITPTEVEVLSIAAPEVAVTVPLPCTLTAPLASLRIAVPVWVDTAPMSLTFIVPAPWFSIAVPAFELTVPSSMLTVVEPNTRIAVPLFAVLVIVAFVKVKLPPVELVRFIVAWLSVALLLVIVALESMFMSALPSRTIARPAPASILDEDIDISPVEAEELNIATPEVVDTVALS